jgi:stage II sporulation protein AA (anti-sigma F factor antagonist)
VFVRALKKVNWRRRMDKQLKEVDGVIIVKLTGQVRISTQNEFKDILDNLVVESGEKNVVINMEDIEFMNSVGLGIIIDTCKKFKEKNGKMVLSNLVPDILNLFEVTELDKFIEIFKTEGEAISTIME